MTVSETTIAHGTGRVRGILESKRKVVELQEPYIRRVMKGEELTQEEKGKIEAYSDVITILSTYEDNVSYDVDREREDGNNNENVLE